MPPVTRRVTLIEGDGIGPEVVGAARAIIEAAGVRITWEPTVIGQRAKELTGELLPQQAVDAIRRNGVALKGPLTTPIGEGFPSVNVQLRKTLDLYACLRPVKNLPGVPSLYSNVDLVIVRENTEDLYAGLEHEVVPGVIESLKIITERASTRIARFAFDYTVQNDRKQVTAVHKANIMKLSDGLFLACCRKVARDYPQIEYREMIVDNAAHQLVRTPDQFDVLLMENLYGDIISDLAAALVGGLGVAPGANIGDGCAVFEAVHGSWPEGAGKNIANPTAMVLSGIMMLEYLGERQAAQSIRWALQRVTQEGSALTSDLGGSATTTEFTDEIIGHLDEEPVATGENG